MNITSLLISFLCIIGVSQGCKQFTNKQCNKATELLEKLEVRSQEQFELTKRIAELQFKNQMLVRKVEKDFAEKLYLVEERLSEKLAELVKEAQVMHYNLLQESDCKERLANCTAAQQKEEIDSDENEGTEAANDGNSSQETKETENDESEKTEQINDDQHHKKQIVADCSGVYGPSGTYEIYPQRSPKPFLAWCDMETWGGSWTVLLHRYTGVQNFALNWVDYKHGFGYVDGEYWLGLDPIYQLTSSTDMELLFEIVQWDSSKYYANYKMFKIGDESMNYYLEQIGGYAGNAGDAFSQHRGYEFHTPDHDGTPLQCAFNYGAGWWFNDCFHCIFTGGYQNEEELPGNLVGKGMHWLPLGGLTHNLKEVKMMVRPLYL